MLREPNNTTFPAPQLILRGAAVRTIEQRYTTAQPPLMERAGEAAAQFAHALLKGKPGAILIAAGPGNNGGDAFVVARRLKMMGHTVSVAFAGEAEKLPSDAHAALNAWHEAGGTTSATLPQKNSFALAIDGLFGIGLARPVDGRYAEWIARLNALSYVSSCPLLALDIPSGLDADSGRILGVAVRATHTATFIALKPGLLTQDGPDHCGAISVHALDLKIDATTPQGLSVTPALFSAALKSRAKNSHKGMYGSVGIIGGARGMSGAALLSARAALKLGAGRVYAGLLDESAPSIDLTQPELMLRPPKEILDGLASCLAIGPGLGQRDAALNLLRGAIAAPLPLVLDADALNLVATHPIFARHIARRKYPTLLTPHPSEAARLLGCETRLVQADRLGAALELALRYNAHTVLKGCGSIVALADGRWFINASGNAGMSSAGQGDVLTGIASALLAQGWGAEQALLGAVHLHGVAADDCVAQGRGPIGLSASETIDAARQCLNRWCVIERN